MNGSQKAIVVSLIATSAIAWVASMWQPDMMVAMTTYDPLAISLFTASWTAGMAAMMFPAITPMVRLYGKFIANEENKGRQGSSSIAVYEEGRPRPPSERSLKVALFVGSYLFIWAVTGVGLLLGWSVVMNNTIMTAAGNNPQLLSGIYGGLLIVAGAYQFTPLKRMCIGYCESPMSFFMRRWKGGTSGAVKMGLWHGMYCLGCCWSYFLLMVALGWMNLLWMGLFAGIIFGEKMWSRGIWIARAAGIGLAVAGILIIAGLPSSLVPSSSSMHDNGDSMMMNGEPSNGQTDMAGKRGATSPMDDMSPGRESSAAIPESLKMASTDDDSPDSRQSANSGENQGMPNMTMK
jgi:predicted metal-binding membrane protein